MSDALGHLEPLGSLHRNYLSASFFGFFGEGRLWRKNTLTMVLFGGEGGGLCFQSIPNALLYTLAMRPWERYSYITLRKMNGCI